MAATFSECSPHCGFPVHRRTTRERCHQGDGLGIRYRSAILCVGRSGFPVRIARSVGTAQSARIHGCRNIPEGLTPRG